jgi:CRP-like cAMP-binding protein
MGDLHTYRLLSTLPRRDRQRFLTGCDRVDLAFSEVLCEPGVPIRHIYFPTDSYISLVSPSDKHASLKVALVGNEGMQGIALVLGVSISPLHALVQGAGPALRMKAAPFRRELQLSRELRHGLNRYIYVRMSRLAQTAACTRFHLVEERLARWLLMTQDREFSNELHITYKFLAYMPGVRRGVITKAAGSLQMRKLIYYRRGAIMVLDCDGLVAASCACYRTDKATYDRVTIQVLPDHSRAVRNRDKPMFRRPYSLFPALCNNPGNYCSILIRFYLNEYCHRQYLRWFFLQI